MKRFVLKFLLAGFLIPFFLFLLLLFLLFVDIFPIVAPLFFLVLYFLWPSSSILILSDKTGSAREAITVIEAVIANVVLYGIIGVLVWLGLYRGKKFFQIILLSLLGLLIYGFIYTLGQLPRAFH